MPSAFRACLALMFVTVALGGDAHAADPFRDTVRPFIAAHCSGCHNPTKKSGDLDLTPYTDAARAADDFRVWENVATFVRSGEMPPPKAKQPTDADRAAALSAIAATLDAEARRLAGDPGPVPPRRLSNAEFDYTVHDLTSVDIRPTESFPLDPASGEGFNNTGEALTVSPALFKKVYAAAEHVADHVLLTADGLRFAPHPVVTFADRQKYTETAIIRFYERHAVEPAVYLAALAEYRRRPADKQGVSVEDWARERGLSAKYARLMWDAVRPDAPADAFVVGWLRAGFASLPADPAKLPDAARKLAADAKRIAAKLTPVETPAIVANAGNGPVDHLDRRRKTADTRDTFDAKSLADTRFTLEYANATDKPSLKVVLVAADAGSRKADGTVTVTGTFSTNTKTTDGKQKWSLADVLPADEAKRVGLGPKGELTLKAPGTLEIDVPTSAFPLKGKGSIVFAVDARLTDSKAGLIAFRVLDRVPTAGDTPEPGRPLVAAGADAADFATSAGTFCRLFPSRFVYVDSTRGLSAGFHLIEGVFRDDKPLCRNVLSEGELRELDGLWDELYFVTNLWEKMLRGFVFFERSERNFLKHPDFDSFKEEDPLLTTDEVLARFKETYLRRSNVKATGEELARHPVSVFFDDIRAGLKRRADLLKQAEPRYLRDLRAFAERAYRRPLTDVESAKLERFFRDVVADPDHGVEDAVRASVVRLLVSPSFYVRIDAPPPGNTVAPLSDLSLASRLSYFIWAGPPDAELAGLARDGKLHEDNVLRQQVRRMTRDEKVTRFSREFFGQWLGYRDFLKAEAVNRQAFPAFDDALKLAMFEEPTRLAAHLIREGRPITELLDGDTTLVNKRLAKHYDMPYDRDEWAPVSGLREKGRGGVLGMAVFLTKNSQPQRTSPVKRGFWVVHKVLGEHIPPPPPDVAVLPAKETDTGGKTVRQLLALHVEDAKCASCHRRFDPVGLAMEGFDPIGRTRTKDLAGRAIDNLVALPDGKQSRGVAEFGRYLAEKRRDDFADTLCRKFLGYALGRSLTLADRPLLEKMRADLARDEYRLGALFETVAMSRQFRDQRCADFDVTKFRERVERQR